MNEIPAEESDMAEWWQQIGAWEALRREHAESGSLLPFELWCEQHEDAQ